MKSTFVLSLALLTALSLFAQNCPKPQASADLNINNLQARILTGGDLFTDGDNGKMIYLPDPSHPSTLFNASLWMGAVDQGGNLKISAMTYRGGSTDFSPGPLDYQTGAPLPTGCTDWDKLFVVNQTEIVSFIDLGPNLSTSEKIQQFPSIMGWPARGNPFFATIHGFSMPNTFQGMAPFLDNDGNGQYDPLTGDLPAMQLKGQYPFIPGQLIWCVMNDLASNGSQTNGTAPLGIEVQLSAWAFKCSGAHVLENTVFTSHKIIYRGTEILDSCYLGLFTDFDLGCNVDDYIGCDHLLDAQYCYNADMIDGHPGNSCLGGTPFSVSPPVQTVTYLDQELDKFISMDESSGTPATSLPEEDYEFYRYLKGEWRDGTPLTKDGNGYNPGSTAYINHAFPANPSSPTGWSMCTANLPLSDRRVVGSVKLGQMEPGKTTELTTAWSIKPDVILPCGIGPALENVKELKEIYKNNFTDCGNLLSPTHTLPVEQLRISPNPANQEINLVLGNTVADELRIIAADGRVVRTLYHLSGDQSIAVNDLATGWYLVQVITPEKIMNGTIIIQR